MLDQLSDTILRQKQIGLAIGQEVDEHNKLLSELEDDVDNADARVRTATRATKKIGEDSSCCCCCCM